MTDKIVNLVAAMRNNPAGIRFADALRVATHYFGPPRNRSTSHHYFPVPWPGDPRVNLQGGKSGKAKEYQIVQLLKAIDKIGV